MNPFFLKLTNTHDRVLTVNLQPWNRQHLLQPGKSCEIVVEGAAAGAVELEWSRERVTLYGWPSSTVTVFENGKELR